jgi:hypothetical protein
MPILEWALWQAGVTAGLLGVWAELRGLRNSPVGLRNKIRTAIELYPCELLFVHRDAEGQGRAIRITEINDTIDELRQSGITIPHVCAVLVRMQEAWLLIDEVAIRTAVGNQYGRVQLQLPRLHEIEALHDPKEVLFELLTTASEFSGRRLRKFSCAKARLRITSLISPDSESYLHSRPLRKSWRRS